MINNIMFYPAIILMIIEIIALVFLILSWRKAKKEQREVLKNT